MSIRIDYGEGAVSLPISALDGCSDILQIKLLMLLSYDRALLSADNIVLAERLDVSEDEISNTIASLRSAGIILPDKKLQPTANGKNLTGEEIAEALENDREFASFIAECQTIFGKIFTPTEVSKLVSIKNNLGYDVETLLLMFFYYEKKLDAVGGKITVSYLEKSAYSLYNQGIRTNSELQEYIKRTEERNSLDFKLRKLFGTGERSFTKKEKKFFSIWSEEWNMPFELIEYAFDITVDRNGKAGLEYMSRILSDWHDSGIRTVLQAEKVSEEFKSSEKYKKKYSEGKEEKKSEKPLSSFDTEEFFEKALKRSYAIMNDNYRKED